VKLRTRGGVALTVGPAKFSVYCLLIFILLIASCRDHRKKLLYRAPLEERLGAARKVSPGYLAAHLKELAGQRIEMEGIVWFEFENISICPADNSLHNSGRCFWIDLSASLPPHGSLEYSSGHRFTIRGIVDPLSKGHLGAYKGTIKNVSYLREL